MSISYEQAFAAQYGRPPRAAERLDPYWIGEVRRGTPEFVPTKAQQRLSEVTAFFPRIAAPQGGTWFGGDQGWYARKAQRHAGCGPVSAVNTLACLAARQPEVAEALNLPFLPDGNFKQRDFEVFMENVYRAVGTFEVPLVRTVAEKSAKGKTLIPPSLGREGSGVESALLRYAAKRGVNLCAHRFSTSYAGKKEALAFIRAGIAQGSPVTLLTLWNRHPLLVYWAGYGQPPKAQPKGMAKHFVSLVGVAQGAGGKPEILASSWGRVCRIDYDSLYQSWQSPKAFGTGMWYYTPTSDPEITKRQMLSAYGAVPVSLAKTMAGMIKTPFREKQEDK